MQSIQKKQGLIIAGVIIATLITIAIVMVILFLIISWNKKNDKKLWQKLSDNKQDTLTIAFINGKNQANFSVFKDIFPYMTNKQIEYVDPIQKDVPIDILVFAQYTVKHRHINARAKICLYGESIKNFGNVYHKQYDVKLCFEDIEDQDPKAIRFPQYFFFANKYDLEAERNMSIAKQLFAQKTKFCCFVVSNFFGGPRNKFFKLLSQYKKVDSGGMYKNNIGGRLPKGKDVMKNFISQYKFMICFENDSTSGYTSEKLPQVWDAGTVPIYWGNPDITTQDFINPKCFINALDFKSLEELCDYVQKVDQDDELYLSYLSQPLFMTPDHKIPDRYKPQTMAHKIKNKINHLVNF